MRNLLLVLRATPYCGDRAREGLDAALLFAAFSDRLRVLFSGDGVWQLQADQAPDALGRKKISALIDAFGLYGIDAAGVDAVSLQARGMASSVLPEDIIVLESQALREWLVWADQVVTIA